MKHLKTFESYTDPKPINFEEVFGFSDLDLAYVLGDLIDKYDYLEFELISNNNNSSFEEMVKELLSVDIL